MEPQNGNNSDKKTFHETKNLVMLPDGQRWLLVFSEKDNQKEKQTFEMNWIKMEIIAALDEEKMEARLQR